MGEPPQIGAALCFYCRLISGSGQGFSRLIDFGHPSRGGHDPLAVMDAAGIRLVDDLAAAGEPLAGRAIHYGRLHLTEVGRHDPEHHHKLRHLLPGGKTQGRRRGVQHIVLLGGEVVRQHPPGISREGGLIDDLVAALDVPGAGDDFLQVRKGGQRDSDR